MRSRLKEASFQSRMEEVLQASKNMLEFSTHPRLRAKIITINVGRMV